MNQPPKQTHFTHVALALFAIALALTAVLVGSACSGGGSQPNPQQQRAAQSTTPSAQSQAQESANRQAAQPDADQEADARQAQAQQQAVRQTNQQAPTQNDSDEQGGSSGASDTDRSEADQPAQFTLSTQPILGGYRFEQPIEMLALSDGSVLVAEQRGSVTRFVQDDGEVEQFGVLDLTDSVSFRGEQGLLSMALDPRLPDRPFLYVYYSPRGVNVTRLSRFRIVQGVALAASELIIIEIPQPYPNHNGGAVRFGPDGMLYLGIGDGGAANDPHGHGQDRSTLLGSIIRIDVGNVDTDRPYQIPSDNPFLDIADARPEIWAYGLRNPWRMAFDSDSGALWVGDVGQNRFEEIAVVQAGENHGWNVFEGEECFRSADACAALTDAVPPVVSYGHDEGCSVTGGEVYRGNAIPALNGHYMFGDYCSRQIWTVAPNGGVEPRLQLDQAIASFAVDHVGELHVLVFGGPILKIVAGER